MEKTYKLKEDARPAALTTNYEELLNDEQLRAVMAPGGRMLIIAGAGSGKTRTLTYRVARLIESGVRPERILLVTFTNRAAREMIARISGILGDQAKHVVAGTFHSVGLRFTREFASKLGFPAGFSILDTGDAEDLLKQCIAELEITKKGGKRFPRARVVLSMKSSALNTDQTLDEVIGEKHEQYNDYLDEIYDVLLRYQTRKQEVGGMDFDDLLTGWRRLLEDHPDVREKLTSRFDHVLVDEYQDTNSIQAELVETMASKRNLTVVGDDCQAIYAFRGANYRNILEFPDRFEDCETYYLQRNYRSTPQIVAVANSSIKHNRGQFQKQLIAQRPDGEKPGVFRCRDNRDESAFVAQRILELRDEGVELDDIAVLYRAHSHAMELQLELGRRNIPFVVRSGQRFFEQRHIKDVLSFLRFLHNPMDELAFLRLAALASGVGPTTARKLYLYVRAHADLDVALDQRELLKIPSSRGQRDWKRVVNVLRRLRQPGLIDDASASIDLIMDAFYKQLLEDTLDRPSARIREIESMATFAAPFGGISEFLDHLALESGLHGTEKLDDEEPDEKVILSTVHQAKGLEFHSVFVLSMVEERFPSVRASFSDEDIEEERRLFYVATTRAKRGLYLCQPLTGFMRGQGLVSLRESRFLTEINEKDEQLLDRWRIS